MHIQTHILSGWMIGNALPLSPRERLFCMIATAAQDLDGLGILVSEELYWDLHHKLGHGLVPGLVLTAILTAFSTHRWLAGAINFALFHLHLLLDYYGSGPGWGLYYLWPFSDWEWMNPNAWPFFSWQNLSAAGAMIAATLIIAYGCRRTPLEAIMPGLDRPLIALLPSRPDSADSNDVVAS